jgi:hypothetical protein
MTAMSISTASEVSMGRRWGLMAAALFLVLCALWTAGSLHFGSAWTKTGSAYSVNSILGYSETERANIVHKENRSFLQQIAMFSGATTDVVDKFYIVRPAYAFAAAFLAPVFGLTGAALVMNLLGWAIAAFCAWSLALRLFGDPLAGLLAVAFVATGMGFAVHVADYSAHLLAFTTYYLGVVILYRSEVWKAPGRGRAVHVAIGAYIALCCLTYNMGLALLFAYIVIAIRHNRLSDVVLASVVGLSAQYVWVVALNLGYALKSGDWSWYNLYGNESAYLGESIRAWLSLWSSPIEGLRGTIEITLEFLSFEFPLTVAAGLVAVVALFWRDRQRLFVLFVLFALPIAGAMAYAQRAAARGYLVFGVSLILYVALGGLIARALRSGSSGRRAAALVTGLVLVGGQIAWSGAHFTGYLGPLRAYYTGLDHAVADFTPRPIEVVSLTNEEPRPAWFGGAAQFDRLGVYQAAGPEQTPSGFVRRLAVSLGSRAIISTYAALLIMSVGALYGWSVWRGALVSLLFFFLAPSLVMAATVKDTIRFVPIDSAGPGARCAAMRYSVRLSNDFRRRLDQLGAAPVHLELFFRVQGDTRLPQFKLDDSDLAVSAGPNEGQWLVTDKDWRTKFGAATTLALTYRYGGDVSYLGWQRNGLPGRTLDFENCETKAAAASLPALEVRAVVDRGVPVLIGF